MKERGKALATLVLCVLFCCRTTSARAENVSPLGFWENEDATFQIFESAGKLCAKIVALKVPKTPEGKEKTDIHNPDPARRGTPIIGLVFMSGFAKKSDTRWRGARFTILRVVIPTHVLWSLKVLIGSRCAGTSVWH
jgi:hypothetical protein